MKRRQNCITEGGNGSQYRYRTVHLEKSLLIYFQKQSFVTYMLHLLRKLYGLDLLYGDLAIGSPDQPGVGRNMLLHGPDL